MSLAKGGGKFRFWFVWYYLFMKYDKKNKNLLDEVLLVDPRVKPGKMFGYPGYYINGKLFACVYEGVIGFKLPKATVAALLDDSLYSPFCPLGRKPMREWIQISPKDPKEIFAQKKLFFESIEFISSLSKS